MNQNKKNQQEDEAKVRISREVWVKVKTYAAKKNISMVEAADELIKRGLSN